MSNPLLFTPPVGPICGWADGAVVRATGIPFATAPRFQKPQAIKDWTAPFQATDWSPSCPQIPIAHIQRLLGAPLDTPPESEDCLHLSVTMPAHVSDHDERPVMVWLHGGSYFVGAGDDPLTDPAHLVAEQGVVVVTVTYRLGLFGYLGDHDRPANLGLLDQREAFRWVRRNIAAFGGDPDNITAFGQSAGGDAITHLMAAEPAEVLFHRAIIQSAPFGLTNRSDKITRTMRRKARTMRQNMSSSEVLHVQTRVLRSVLRYGMKAGMAFGVEYGQAPLPAKSTNNAPPAARPDISVLVGSTATETTFFFADLLPFRLLRRIPLIGVHLFNALARATTRHIYDKGADDFASRQAATGGTAYRYRLTWSAPGNVFSSPHTIDLPLLFGQERRWGRAMFLQGAPWTQIEHDGKALRALWADFARGGPLGEHFSLPNVLHGRRVRAH